MPIKCVNADFGILTSWSQKMLLVMLEAFVNADLDLRGEPIEGGKDRRADSSRKPGVNKGLAADNREHAEVPRVVARPPVNPVEFAAYHRSTW